MRTLFVVFALFMVVSCAQPDRRISTLWTDVPEIIGAVEQYNATQKEWQILLEYHTDLQTALTGPNPVPDLVIGRSLENAQVKATLAPLDFLFDRGDVAKASFYRKLLDTGSLGTDLKLVPLSFDLPVLVYSTDQLPDLEPFSLSIDRVRQLSADFNALKAKNGLKLAFSPLWDSFPLQLLHLSGAAFGEGFQGGLGWDSSRLGQGLELLADWTSKEALGDKVQKEFTLKYLSTSPWPLLRDGRILFYPSTVTEFLTLPFDERRGLGFRYLESGDKIAASDSVLWAGIPIHARNPGAARDFLSDFLSPARQKSLATWAKTNEFRPFGITGGLSSLVATNTGVLATLYPELAFRVPEPDRIQFWLPLPSNWAELRDKLINPWLATLPGPDRIPAFQDDVAGFGKPSRKK